MLLRFIDEDGLRGLTSNPSIFEKAIVAGRDYDESIRALSLAGESVEGIYRALVIDDIQRAADLFRPVFERLDGRDGFVSLEVSPHLAHDTRGTIAEARRLWAAVSRPNVMIKVPGTLEGLPAIEALIAEGIPINVTLLFGLGRYERVADAYLSALEARAARGGSVHVASVASFFLSRIDVAIDAQLDALVRETKISPELHARLRGATAIACARVAYQRYLRIFESERFQALAAKGARTQRLLWASTSTKDPSYGDVKYVDALIGERTIDTVPIATFEAYRDHGDPAPRLEAHVDEARATLERLGDAGIDLDDVTQRLEDEGVRKFVEPYDHLMDVLAERRADARRGARPQAPEERP
jgi:transaldolase/transaldolase/glucose-6-phosphate isomerase